MSLASHSNWAQEILGTAPAKKTFRIVDSKSPKEATSIDISLLQDAAGAEGASAEQPGWVVNVQYSNAPDVILFNQTYVSEDMARKVMDDLAMVAGEVEGLLRKEEFEKAQAKTTELINKMHANSGQAPVTPVE